MPCRRGASGLAKVVGSPSTAIRPASGWITPEITLIIVLLPAPLSPTSATTSLRCTVMAASCSARTVP
jgi:hypothetical protein